MRKPKLFRVFEGDIGCYVIDILRRGREPGRNDIHRQWICLLELIRILFRDIDLGISILARPADPVIAQE